MGIVIIVAIGILLFFVLSRPQRARQQAQRRLLETIEPGDEVLTVGGLYGIVQEIDDEGDLIVEIADGIHVRIARRGVATVVKPDEGEDDAEGETEEPDAEPDEQPALEAGSADEPGVKAEDEQPARA